MNDEILIINEYPIDWEWLIDVFATMTDDTDTYSYITYAEEDGAKLTDITFVRTVDLLNSYMMTKVTLRVSENMGITLLLKLSISNQKGIT